MGTLHVFVTLVETAFSEQEEFASICGLRKGESGRGGKRKRERE